MSAHILKICYWQNKQTQKSTVFTTWQRNCQHFTYDTCSIERHMKVRMRQFQGISTPDGHCARDKGSSDRRAVKWRKMGKIILSSWIIWWKLYSSSTVYFLNKTLSRTSCISDLPDFSVNRERFQDLLIQNKGSSEQTFSTHHESDDLYKSCAVHTGRYPLVTGPSLRSRIVMQACSFPFTPPYTFTEWC
jgi:hypothetical protein